MIDLIIPQGQLLRSRIVPDVRTVLVTALDRTLTGYAIVESQNALPVDTKGILTFEDGIPILAYHTGTDTGGKRALSEFASDGPCRLDLYVLSSNQLKTAHDTPELRVPPEMPANRLTDDPMLAARTRKRAVTKRERETNVNGKKVKTGTDSNPAATQNRDPEKAADAVEAFLEDIERIEAIREQARAEAKRRADEWGLDDQLK